MFAFIFSMSETFRAKYRSPYSVSMFVDKAGEYSNKRLVYKVMSRNDAVACLLRLQKAGNYIRKAWFTARKYNMNECICTTNIIYR